MPTPRGLDLFGADISGQKVSRLIDWLINPLSTADRIALGATLGPDNAGLASYDIQDLTLYTWTGTAWGSSVASVVWGTIGGLLSNQTDLQNALNAKQNTITLGSTAQYFRGDLSLATFPTLLSDFTNDVGFITASSINTLTNKSGLISQWTNDVGYLTSVVGFVSTSRTLTIDGVTFDLSANRSWTTPTFTLTNGQGTTANGTAVDLGGTITSNRTITGSGSEVISFNQLGYFQINSGAPLPSTGDLLQVSGNIISILNSTQFTQIQPGLVQAVTSNWASTTAQSIVRDASTNYEFGLVGTNNLANKYANLTFVDNAGSTFQGNLFFLTDGNLQIVNGVGAIPNASTGDLLQVYGSQKWVFPNTTWEIAQSALQFESANWSTFSGFISFHDTTANDTFIITGGNTGVFNFGLLSFSDNSTTAANLFALLSGNWQVTKDLTQTVQTDSGDLLQIFGTVYIGTVNTTANPVSILAWDTVTKQVVSTTVPGGTVTSVSGTANRITSTGGATPVIDISAAYIGQSSITTLGTITTGVWHGTAIANANLANSAITINGASTSLGGSVNIVTTGTANRISVSGGSGLAPTIDISAIYVGQTSITTLGTIATGTWQGTAIGDTWISSAATWNSKQAGSANLTSLSGLTFVSTSFVKMTSAGTFALDTNTYLTGNQTITLSSEASGSGATSIAVTLSNAAVIGKVLTGYVSGAGTISATDSILGAIQKLNGNIAALTTGVSSVFGRVGAVTAQSGDYSTNLVTENTNLYFTNARAIAAPLTGYVSGAGTVAATDSILQAIQKLNGNTAALVTGVSSVFGRSGAVTAQSGDYTTAQVTESGNLYYTNARGIGSVLTGYVSGAGTVAATDTILQAIQKLNGNTAALVTGVSSVNSLTGAVALTGTANRITISGANVFDISASYVGQSSITTLGTITTGTLGTGAIIAGVTMTLGSDASNDVYYRNSSGILTRLANGTTGQFLSANTGAAPTWNTPVGTTYTFSTGLTNTSGTITANLVTGLSGGQTATGGTAASENLTLQSTTNGTKGKINLGSAATSFFDEANSYLNIETDGLGASSTSITQGLMLKNATVATVGNPKISPALILQGQAWNTTTGTSGASFWKIYNTTQSSNGGFKGNLNFDISTDGGTTWSTLMTLTASSVLLNATWSGNTIVVGRGGTGLTGASVGDIIYGSALNTYSSLAIGANNTALVSNGTIPGWAAIANSVSNSDGTLTISPTTGAVVASLALGHANTWTGVQSFNAGSIVALANSTSLPALTFTPSGASLLTSPVAGAMEVDSKGLLYYDVETTAGRGYVPSEQHFRLTANGGNISTIANFFGTTSNITLVASAEYLIEIECYYTNTTSGTVTWTFTNSAAPTLQNIYAKFSPAAGIVAPAGSAAATYLEGNIQGDNTAAKALTTSPTLTTGTTQYAYFKIRLINGTGTSFKIQATKLVGGTITPLAGSYWRCTRLPAANVGTFAA